MSTIAPEGGPKAADEPAQIRASHVAGGSLAVAVGAVAVAVCNHFGWQLSDVDGVLVGSAAISSGVGLGHIVGKVGIFGAFKQLLHGRNA